MLDDEVMQQEAAKVREQARDLRRDFNREGKAPEWGLVDLGVVKPLNELKEKIGEEIAKREKPDAQVPLDRDPVPRAYEDLVKRYYERLGSGEE